MLAAGWGYVTPVVGGLIGIAGPALGGLAQAGGGMALRYVGPHLASVAVNHVAATLLGVGAAAAAPAPAPAAAGVVQNIANAVVQGAMNQAMGVGVVGGGADPLAAARALSDSSAQEEGVKDLLSTTLTSGLVLAAVGMGTRALLGVYGDSMARTITGNIQGEMARFRQRRPAPHDHAPHDHADHAPHRANDDNNNNYGGSTVRWDEWGRSGGKREEGGALAFLPLDSLGVHLLLFGSVLSLLHYWGAREAKEHLRLEHSHQQARREAAVAARGGDGGAPNISITTDEQLRLMMGADGAWDQLANRDAAAHSSRQREHSEALLLRPQRAWLEDKLHALYMASPYYNPTTTPRRNSLYFLSLSDVSVVRLLVNTMLGFIVQGESLLRGGRAPGAGGFHSVARIVTGLFFWELLTRALRLYGWAPVYVATQHVVRLLTEATRAGGR
jgi:hypothetical protein